MKVLITGSNGFIGSYLASQLDKKNYEVKRHIRNQKKLLNNADHVFFTTSDLETAVKEIDVVIHCAGKSGPSKNQRNDWDSYHEANAIFTKKVALLAAKNNVKKFIYLSTIKVYGEETLGGPITLNSKLNPADFYAKSKLLGEKELKAITEKNSMSHIILRPGLVYGKEMRGSLNSLRNLIKYHIPLPVGLLKSNKRSMLSIINLLSFINLALKSDQASNNTFLLCDDKNYSTYELVEALGKSINAKPLTFPLQDSFIEFIGKSFGKETEVKKLTRSLQIDNSFSKQLLGWKPKSNLVDTLIATW